MQAHRLRNPCCVMFVDNGVLISLKVQDVERDQEANPHVAYPVLGCASRSESFLHPRGHPCFNAFGRSRPGMTIK